MDGKRLQKVIEPEVIEPEVIAIGDKGVEAKEGNRQFAEQLTIQFVSMVADGVSTGLQIWQGREATAQNWENVKQQLALMDEQSKAQIRDLEHDLAKMTDRTARLNRLLDYYATLDPAKASLIASSIGKAIEQLAQG